MTDAEIVDKIRMEIRNTPKSVCPFARAEADNTLIVVVDQITEEAMSKCIDQIKWSENTILIVASREYRNQTVVDRIAYTIQINYPHLEAFGACPGHSISTRRDDISNIQINTRASLLKARESLKAKKYQAS